MELRNELLERFGQLTLYDANEAETRLKLIDRIIFEYLGWTHDDVSVEQSADEDGTPAYTDYVIRTGFSSVVVEAKRVGKTFDTPLTTGKHLLRGSIMSGTTGETIKQARTYARNLSIPFACITNGAQWIVFPATRIDQVPFSKSTAIVFSSLEDVLDDTECGFKDLLFRPNFIDGSLDHHLLGRATDQLQERRLNHYFAQGFSKNVRNEVFPLIEDAIITAFTEDFILRDPSLLEKCYVQTPERMRFDSRINMHIRKRSISLEKPPSRPMKRKDRAALDNLIRDAEAKTRPIAIFVVGAVGAGKTTFLNYTRSVSAKNFFIPKSEGFYPHWIYLDFKKHLEHDSAIDFMYDCLFDYIKNDNLLRDYERCLKHAYKADTDALLAGPLKPLGPQSKEVKSKISEFMLNDWELKRPAVEKIIKFVSTRAPIFLVIDNVDQLEVKNSQERVFADAIALAQKLGLNLVLSMRDSTYAQHKNRPTFDAFDFDPIYIDPPSIPAVLAKRFFLATELLIGKSGEFTSGSARIKIDNLSDIILLVKQGILGTEIGTLIEVMASSDIRLALRMTREALQYGYTDTARAVKVFQRTGKYNMPRHEAMRAITLGNNVVYKERHSVVGNPFDARLAINNAQMLRLFILNALVIRASSGENQKTSGDEIRNTLRSIGFGDKVILQVLTDLCRLRFCFSESHSEPSFDDNFIASRFGGYITKILICDFTYLELIMMDTFVGNQTNWQELKELSSKIHDNRDRKRGVELRIERCKKFYDFLEDIYKPIAEDASRRALPAEWCGNPLTDLKNTFQHNLNKVILSSNRQLLRK